MPSRRETSQAAIDCFDSANYPQGLDIESAWLGFYQTLLWYEAAGLQGHQYLPHIIDANMLRQKLSSKGKMRDRLTAWPRRAIAFEEYFADKLECKPQEVAKHVDKLMRRREFRGMQRQNPLGTAFPALVLHLLEKYGNEGIRWEAEAHAQDLFPGIPHTGRSARASIDIVGSVETLTRVIISCKWSLRHDRINDITEECPSYKSAANRLRAPILYYVITNEYQRARLMKILDEPCVDGLIHVHKPAVVSVCDMDGSLGSMLDLSELAELSQRW